jgi:hypothetical protein
MIRAGRHPARHEAPHHQVGADQQAEAQRHADGERRLETLAAAASDKRGSPPSDHFTRSGRAKSIAGNKPTASVVRARPMVNRTTPSMPKSNQYGSGSGNDDHQSLPTATRSSRWRAGTAEDARQRRPDEPAAAGAIADRTASSR